MMGKLCYPAIVFLLLAVTFLSACGKKGGPSYKKWKIPSEITDVNYLVRPDEVFVSWQYPHPEREGLSFEIFRCISNKCELRGVTSKNFYTDNTPPEQGLQYLIVSTLKSGGKKEKGVSVSVEGFPEAPGAFRYEILNDGIRLSWYIFEGCLYNIYRVVPSGERLWAKGLKEGYFIDAPDPSEVVHYRIRCQRNNTEGYARELKITPEQYIPSRPEGLRYAIADEKVMLTWRESPEKWVRGYRIYRGDEKGHVKIGESLYPLFIDTDKPLGRFSYFVTALGPSKESEFSEPLIIP